MLLTTTNSNNAFPHLHHQEMKICPKEPMIHPQNSPLSQTEEEQREENDGQDKLEKQGKIHEEKNRDKRKQE